MPHWNDMENIFPHVHGWNVWMKMEHQWTFWMIIARRQIIWMKDLSSWNVWMKLIPKQLCQMKTTCTWMTITKNMKYLDEHGTLMNFWMIIGSRRIVWMKVIPKQLQWMEITQFTKFSCPTSFGKKNVKGEIRKSYIAMQKGETITCVS
jgi:hypothetical protein